MDPKAALTDSKCSCKRSNRRGFLPKSSFFKTGIQGMNPSQSRAQPGAENADRVFNTLQSLRRSFIRIGGVVLICSGAGYYLAEPVLRHLRDLTGVKLAAYGIPKPFSRF